MAHESIAYDAPQKPRKGRRKHKVFELTISQTILCIDIQQVSKDIFVSPNIDT